jgi:hypothetical protein
MGEGKWCYSFNEENFEGDFRTKAEAIAEAEYYVYEADDDRDFIYVGQTKEVIVSINTNWLLDQLGEQAYEQAGEYAEDYLYDVSREHESILEERLNDVLYAWMEEFNYKPNFWTVENVQKVLVTRKEEQ